jgi:hypothetical protein
MCRHQMILLRIAPAPACRTVIITGRQIGKIGGRGWVHTAQQRRWPSCATFS